MLWPGERQFFCPPRQSSSAGRHNRYRLARQRLRQFVGGRSAVVSQGFGADIVAADGVWRKGRPLW